VVPPRAGDDAPLASLSGKKLYFLGAYFPVAGQWQTPVRGSGGAVAF